MTAEGSVWRITLHPTGKRWREWEARISTPDNSLRMDWFDYWEAGGARLRIVYSCKARKCEKALAKARRWRDMAVEELREDRARQAADEVAWANGVRL